MSGFMSVLALATALWILVGAATIGGVALLWPLLEQRIRSLPAAGRERVAWSAALAPGLLGGLVVLLCSLPGLVGAISGAGDHCGDHSGHAHFCPIHPWLPLNAAFALPLLLGLSVGIRMLSVLARAFATMRSEARWLDSRTAESIAEGVSLIDDAAPLAFTHGLLRPRIWLSRALLDALPREERRIVIAHERAHAMRRDPLRALLLRVACALHPPGLRARIASCLRLANEQACDAAAVRACGDRLRVASTLLRVERLLRRAAPRPPLTTASLLATDLPARIEALLAEDAEAPVEKRWRGDLIVVAALALAFVGARPVHHAVEHALELLLRSLVGLRLLS